MDIGINTEQIYASGNDNLKNLNKFQEDKTKIIDFINGQQEILEDALENLKERGFNDFNKGKEEEIIKKLEKGIQELEMLKKDQEFLQMIVIPSAKEFELNQDPDLDGKTTREELAAGTNPYVNDKDIEDEKKEKINLKNDENIVEKSFVKPTFDEIVR